MFSKQILSDFFKEEEPEKIEERQQAVCSLLKIPLFITYHVNVFYYSKDYYYLKFDSLINEIDTEDINPLFYKFVSKLGNVYTNEKGEKILSYKDTYYHIIFELIDTKKSQENKIKHLENNLINIIWIDNKYRCW